MFPISIHGVTKFRFIDGARAGSLIFTTRRRFAHIKVRIINNFIHSRAKRSAERCETQLFISSLGDRLVEIFDVTGRTGIVSPSGKRFMRFPYRIVFSNCYYRFWICVRWRSPGIQQWRRESRVNCEYRT